MEKAYTFNKRVLAVEFLSGCKRLLLRSRRSVQYAGTIHFRVPFGTRTASDPRYRPQIDRVTLPENASMCPRYSERPV